MNWAVTMGDPVANSGQAPAAGRSGLFSGLFSQPWDIIPVLVATRVRLATVAVADKGSWSGQSSEIGGLPVEPAEPGVLDHLPPAAVFGEALAFLEGPGLLQERFLRVESHRTAFALSSCHTLGPQGAYATDRRVELKTLDRIGLTQPVGPGAEGPQGVGNITGWQVTVPAARSIWKSSLGKWALLGRPGTLAISVRSASAKACRVPPSP